MNKIVKGVFGAVLGLSAGLAGAVTVEKGVEITLEAEAPEAKKAFHHWEGTGAPTGEAAFQPTWTYVPTASGEVTPVYGKLETVTDGGDLAAKVAAASVDGGFGVVRAGAGTYTISAQLALGSVRLEGNGRDGAGASVLTQSGSGFRALFDREIPEFDPAVHLFQFIFRKYLFSVFHSHFSYPPFSVFFAR